MKNRRWLRDGLWREWLLIGSLTFVATPSQQWGASPEDGAEPDDTNCNEDATPGDVTGYNTRETGLSVKAWKCQGRTGYVFGLWAPLNKQTNKQTVSVETSCIGWKIWKQRRQRLQSLRYYIVKYSIQCSILGKGVLMMQLIHHLT